MNAKSDWTESLIGTKSESEHTHAAEIRTVDMLRLDTATGSVLVGYSYIRRIEYADSIIVIFASECIIEIVGTQCDQLIEPLQRHSLHQLAIGEQGITHINIKETR